MARITNPIELKIGHWYTFCCERDLTQIASEEELEEVRNDLLEDGMNKVWETKEEALLEIKSWWAGNRPVWIPGL
jgi:hypothetical protein